MNTTPEVLVIGGGINGVSIAYHLARHKIKVTLIEKSFIAGGPTGWSSAIIRQHYSNPVTIRMAMQSLRVWQNFDEIVGGDPGFSNTGFLIGIQPEGVGDLKKNIEFQQSFGINTQFVNPEDIKQIEPHMDPSGLGGFAYEPEGGYCDPTAAANAFAKAAQRLGVSIRTGVTATGFRVDRDIIQGVETDQGFIPAKSVLVAAGPWSLRLLHTMGIELPMVIARIKIGLYRRPEDFDRHSVVGDFVNQVYMRPETGEQMLVGSISPGEAKDQIENPDHFKEKVGMDVLAEFAERIANRYPAMERGYLASNFASLYDITPDWHTILDTVPGLQGLYVCAGTSGHGFKLAPAVGAMMTNFIINGKKPDDDINLFAFDRFRTGNLVRGKYEYSIIG